MCLMPKAEENQKPLGCVQYFPREVEEVPAVLSEQWGTPAVFVECLETLCKQRKADGCVMQHSPV